MEECSWNPEKHGGKPCPKHGAKGMAGENKYKVNIKNGKHVINFGEDEEELSQKEYNELRNDESREDFDLNNDDDFGFDEEPTETEDSEEEPDDKEDNESWDDEVLEAARQQFLGELEDDYDEDDPEASKMKNEYEKVSKMTPEEFAEYLKNKKDYDFEGYLQEVKENLENEENNDDDEDESQKEYLANRKEETEKFTKQLHDAGYDLKKDDYGVKKLNNEESNSDFNDAKQEVDKYSWNFREDIKTWLKDSPYELSDEDIEFIAKKARIKKGK